MQEQARKHRCTQAAETNRLLLPLPTHTQSLPQATRLLMLLSLTKLCAHSYHKSIPWAPKALLQGCGMELCPPALYVAEALPQAQ